ncbi:MAG: hypothetical protein IT263_12765 [Saprospiraceae bacterium]|nr:hypothetical protein [Saprospiraceae bacterium]
MNNLISYFDNITALSNPIQNVIPRVYVDYKIIFPNLSSAKGFLKQIEKSSKNITTNVVTLNSEEFDPYNPMVEIAINCYSGVVQNLEAVPKDWSREYRTIKGSKPINNFAYTEFLEIDLGLNKISNEVKSELVENMLLGLTIPYLILHYDYPDYSNISNGVLIHIWHEFRTNKFQLTNVKNIALEGLTFKELPINARRAFSGYLIDCTIVECSPENPLYQQFLTNIKTNSLNNIN